MPAIQQKTQPRSAGEGYEETPEQTAAWKALRRYIRDNKILVDSKFTLKGRIRAIKLNNGGYFEKTVKDAKGNDKPWYYVVAECEITDERFGEPGLITFAPKNVGSSFFDGVTKRGRSDNRGGMYDLHYACIGAPPSPELIAGNGQWDTEDYEGKPILLRLIRRANVEEGTQYYGRRANLTVFVDGFERDPEFIPSDLDDEDDNDDDPPFAKAVVTPGPSAKATERQVRFIFALGVEAGMNVTQVNEWSEELYNVPVDSLNSRDASTFIEALHRKRNEPEDKVIATAPVKPQQAALPATDDDDESFD